jgi:hypothetical protein
VRAQDIATNTTITVDCDFDCHRAFPFSVFKNELGDFTKPALQFFCVGLR